MEVVRDSLCGMGVMVLRYPFDAHSHPGSSYCVPGRGHSNNRKYFNLGVDFTYA